MSATTQALNREQLTFLEDNFVVYDFYKKCHQKDFSGLENCQVILMGEIHSSSVLWNIQRQFFAKIIGNQSICFLAEALAEGVTLNAEKIWELHDYLPLTTEVRGADVRDQGSSAQSLEWRKLNRKIVQLSLEKKEQDSADFRQLAKILNDHFTSGSSSGIDKDEQMFLMSDEVLEVVAKLVKNFDQETGRKNEESNKIRDQLNQIRESTFTEDSSHMRSNFGLFQEIEKACKQFPKVMPLWGKEHFTTDEGFIRALDRAQISYAILLPNKQRQIEANDEHNWVQGDMPTFELKLGRKTQPLVLEVPLIFQSYLHPALQAICITKAKEELTVLDAAKLHELFREKDSHDFSAGKEVHFENIPLADFNKLRELFDDKNEITNEQARPMVGHVRMIINNLLMINGLSVGALRFKGQITCGVLTTFEDKPVLKISSDEGWSLAVSSNPRIGYASYLFQEMKRLNMTEYSLAPGEALFFMDLSQEEQEQMMESPNSIGSWIDSKLPPRAQLKLEGELSCAFSGIEPFEGAPILPALVLTAETGLTITLT